MQHGMMGGMPMMGMHGHMMKVMFAIADVDGDGALSFEEVTTVHKRMFDKVDANRDGKVTPVELGSHEGGVGGRGEGSRKGGEHADDGHARTHDEGHVRHRRRGR